MAKRWPVENDKLSWPTFDFWWLLSLVLTWLRHGSLDVNVAPEYFIRAQRITQRAPGDSSQAEDGASPRTGSNYPPFQNRWLRYRRAGHRNGPICVELWEVHAVHFHINLTGHRRERQTWLSGIISHSLCPRWRGEKSQRGNERWGERAVVPTAAGS